MTFMLKTHGMYNQGIRREFEKDGKHREDYFDGICTSFEEGVAKPDRRIFEAVVGKFGIRPEMSLDVGSVGKGYAVEMVCRAAEARGLTSALVSVGGNLRAIGTKPDGSQWTGGVENPWNASEVYTNTNSIFGSPVNMSDLALVTSGDYQRYFVVDGKRYHHIIDPDTLWPAAYYNGVTVLCPDSGMADCLTTALFCMPLEEGQKLVESLDGVEAMWCTPDKQATTSSGWDSHLKK